MQHVFPHSFGMVLLLAIALCLSGSAVAGVHEDLNAVLDGEFAFTETRLCDDGFASIGKGMFSYDGEGTGSVVGTRSGAAFFGNLSFTVSEDGSFTQDMVLTATIPGGTVTVTRTGIRYEGQISDDGEVLLLSDANANQETLSRSDTGFLRFSTCGRSTIAVQIRPL